MESKIRLDCKSGGNPVTVLTAYDYPMGRILDEAGVDWILVGDSLGMVVLGYPDTTSVTMDDMVHHVRAVARGVKRALVIGDLPFRSYDTVEDALKNARRLIDAGAGAVKLEGNLPEQIRAITEAGIPVMAHLGMLPQQVKEEGGYKIKGKTGEETALLIEQAVSVQEAGAFSVVLELVTPETALQITDSTRIPTIGIGSGVGCDGQVLVTYDLVGMFPWFKPRFVKQRAFVGEEVSKAVKEFITEIKAGAVVRQ